MRWVATLLAGALALALISVPFAMATSKAVGDPLTLELFSGQGGRAPCPPVATEFETLRPVRPVADWTSGTLHFRRAWPAAIFLQRAERRIRRVTVLSVERA